MLAFFTPAFWIMMIQMNALHLRMVPGSQAAEPRRRRHRHRPQTIHSHQTTPTSEISGGAARPRRTTRASQQPMTMTPNDGDFTARNISRTTASTAQDSAEPAKPVTPRPADSPPARITEVSDDEVCPQCQCLLKRSERNKNKVGKARRGRCDDCFRSMPAPVALAFLMRELYERPPISATGAGIRGRACCGSSHHSVRVVLFQPCFCFVPIDLTGIGTEGIPHRRRP